MGVRTSTLVVCVVAIMHVYQAVIMLAFVSAAGATPLIALLKLSRIVDSPDGRYFVAAVMIAMSGVAVVGALANVGWIRLTLLVPQQVLLGVQAGGGICAAFLGRYLDGVVILSSHIAVDQVPLTALFIIHISAILRRARYS